MAQLPDWLKNGVQVHVDYNMYYLSICFSPLKHLASIARRKLRSSSSIAHFRLEKTDTQKGCYLYKVSKLINNSPRNENVSYNIQLLRKPS